jgi:membrane protein implicated in regulation of membrane protease activity
MVSGINGIPGWAVALIVISILLVIALLFLLIRRFVKKKQSPANIFGNIELPPHS